MRRYLLGVLGAVFAGFASIAILSPAGAATATGTVKVQWHAPPVITFSLTPNYASGYGSLLATFGTQPTPTAGPGASLKGGTVDFGTTLAGDTYLYKYAAELQITTNDSNGFDVYGEAATMITNNSDGSVYPTQALFYVPSVLSGDTNTGFTPGVPFTQTGGVVSGGGDNKSTPATIAYATYPNPVAVSALANNNYYYDYQFRVPSNATSGNYYVWIVYTVVG
ncbi:MAG TPA: hypothetical protein VF741_00460, partial [Candidatus Aquilonibacter sp.]